MYFGCSNPVAPGGSLGIMCHAAAAGPGGSHTLPAFKGGYNSPSCPSDQSERHSMASRRGFELSGKKVAAAVARVGRRCVLE